MSGGALSWVPAGKDQRGAVLLQLAGYDLAIADHPGRWEVSRMSTGEVVATGFRSLAAAKEAMCLWWGVARLDHYRLKEAEQKSEAS